MLSGITTTCFAASYAVALALEISRLFFRSGIRGAVMLAFAGAGLFAQTVFLVYRVGNTAGSPLSSKQDWCLIAAWILVVIYLYLTFFHPKAPFGVFLLPLVLGLIGVGTLLADSEPFGSEPASRVWGAIHGISLLLATVSVLIGFVAGLMYLHQSSRLKRKLPPRAGLRLPSLEWLQKANARAIVVAIPTLGLGVLSGIVLNLIHYGRQSGRVPWSDLFVLSTIFLFAWLLLSALVGLWYRPAREGHKVAYFTVVSCVFLAVALGIGLFVEPQHGQLQPRRPASSSRVQRLGHGGSVPRLPGGVA